MSPAGSGNGTPLRSVLAVVAAAHLVLLLSPWRFYTPSLGLDPSWIQVISHAAASGWQWGRDIVFTYGPLGYLRNPVFGEALIAPALLWNGFLSLASAIAVVSLLRRVPTAGAIAIYLLIAFAAAMRSGHAAYMMLPLFAALLYLRRPEAPAWVPAVLLVAAGVYADGYASLLALGALTSALMDVSRLRRRRVPLFTAAFAAAVIVSYLLAGQELGSLPRYLRSLIEVVAGYADAMAVYGNGYETIAFLGISATAVALVVRCERPRLADPRRRVDAWLLLLLVGCYGYVVWKSGFVRHDSHSVFAWRALAIGIAAYTAVTWPDIPSRSLRASMLALALASCGAIALVSRVDGGPAPIFAQLRTALVDAELRSLAQGFVALTDPAGWRAERRRTNDAAFARMRAALPYLDARGSVDLVGLDQGALLAHGVDYRPQPVFQPFVAYTPWLIELNRRHLRSANAADTLLVGSTTIDNHYPMSDLGASIVELLALYRAEDVAGEYARLIRRPVPRAVVLAESGAFDVPLGDWVPVSSEGGGVMLQARLRPGALGTLARLAWRMPESLITVRLADGSERTHRIVPAIAAAGFLLSPYAESSAIIAGYSAGMHAEADAHRVVAVKVDAQSPSARRFFQRRARLRLMRLELPSAGGEAAAPGVLRHFARREIAARLARSVADAGAKVEARGTMLFAHAPAAPELEVSAGATLRVRYGILDGAWTGGGRTDGVCFRIRAIRADGSSATLHERCLAPLERTEDRGEQEATVRVVAGPVRVVLETDCRGNCSWDWSYWNDIDLTP